MSVWCRSLVLNGVTHSRVRITGTPHGTVAALEEGADPRPGDLMLELALPGIADAHSHAFHRVLRGRTHDRGGDFWIWREQMYAAAAKLDPDLYRRLAAGVFAEMVAAGYTAVGEFHYVHHRPGGEPYPYEMELAVAEAATSVGIRLTLLDTVYLTGGVGRPLQTEQARFGDGDAERYLERWHALARRVPGLGAAIHSLRAVPLDAMRIVRDGLPDDIPLHIHLSEQPEENKAVHERFGVTPTRLLADEGLLSPRLAAVHATHLGHDDIRLLGEAQVSIVMCPTTEADLGDGIGPARQLLDAGATLAIGSDQNAVVDPLLEIRGLEMQERLRSGLRGRFTPAELAKAAGVGGYRALGLAAPLQPGGCFDVIGIDPASVRTIGSSPEQVLLAATASDVTRVVIGGRLVAADGVLVDGRRPAHMLGAAMEGMS